MVADPHEIANVFGLSEGFSVYGTGRQEALDIFMSIPSSVPLEE